MSSKKNLKKAVKAICGDLFADGIIVCSNESAAANPEVEKVMTRIAVVYQDYVSRINNPEPGMAPSAYFGKLRNDFTAEANDIAQELLKAVEKL